MDGKCTVKGDRVHINIRNDGDKMMEVLKATF